MVGLTDPRVLTLSCVSVPALFAIQWVVRESSLIEPLRPKHMDDVTWPKFRKQIFKTVWHTMSASLCWMALRDLGLTDLGLKTEAVHNNIDLLWSPEPDGYDIPQTEQPLLSASMFGLHLAYYTAVSAYWVLVELPEDFWMMLIHHIITPIMMFIAMTGNSLWLGGLVILAVTETTDVFLASAKCLHYYGQSFGMAVFAVVYTQFRIWWFTHLVFATVMSIPRHTAHYWQFFAGSMLLILFQAMHYIWYYGILRSLVLSIMKGKIVDTRDKDEVPDEPTPKKEAPCKLCGQGPEDDD